MFAPLAEALAARGFHRFDVFSFHPLQLAAYLEALWELRRRNPPPKLGANPVSPSPFPDPGLGSAGRDRLTTVLDTGIPSLAGPSQPDLGGTVFADVMRDAISMAFGSSTPSAASSTVGPPAYWHHLIYAYLIENTRAFDVFERVLFEALHGEKLGFLDEPSHRWLRTTEDLFFRDVSQLMVDVRSSVRPDLRATRRNAYYRMFGMDLNHGDPRDNTPYRYERPEAFNGDFVTALQAFFGEVWRGYVNARNTSGPNTTDNSAIAFLATRLHQMLRDRRQSGNLAREEFVSVAMMSWFDLTLSDDSPIVISLKASASSPEERLRRIGERVGVSAHGKARSLFELSWRVSGLLTQIERGAYNDPINVPVLYTPYPSGNVIAADMVEMIIHWSMATGRDLKAVPVSPAPTAIAIA